jgi:hypothetical protein
LRFLAPLGILNRVLSTNPRIWLIPALLAGSLVWSPPSFAQGRAVAEPLKLVWGKGRTPGQVDVLEALKMRRLTLGISRSQLAAALAEQQPTPDDGHHQWMFDGEVAGLVGSWTFDFEAGKLARIGFEHDRNLDEEEQQTGTPLSREKIERELSALARTLQTDLTNVFGKPHAVRTNARVHDYDDTEHAARYLLFAQWRSARKEVGKGETTLLLKIAIASPGSLEED